MLTSAAFRFKCLRWPFLFRGSFSTPSPRYPQRTYFTIALSTSEIKDRRPTMQKKSDCLLHSWGCSGRRAPSRRSGKGRASLCQGAGVFRLGEKAGERQLTCRETSFRTCILSGAREGEGRAEKKALPAGVERVVGSREPPAAAPRSLPAAAVPH